MNTKANYPKNKNENSKLIRIALSTHNMKNFPIFHPKKHKILLWKWTVEFSRQTYRNRKGG